MATELVLMAWMQEGSLAAGAAPDCAGDQISCAAPSAPAWGSAGSRQTTQASLLLIGELQPSHCPVNEPLQQIFKALFLLICSVHARGADVMSVDAGE